MAVPGLLETPSVLVMDWDTEFLPWIRGDLLKTGNTVGRPGGPVALSRPWAPGMHMALIGKTGEGKTTFAAGILGVRKYVLAMDPKGQDKTLAATGYRRILEVPRSGDESARQLAGRWLRGQPRPDHFPRDIQKDLDEGRPVRLIVGGASRTRGDDEKLKRLLADTLAYVRSSTGWTLYADEYQVLSDMRMFSLGPLLERMLITARTDRVSLVTAYQAPAWVPKAATRQARLIVTWKTNSRDAVKSIAESAGRDWREVGAVMDQLPPFHALVIPDDLRAPMMITQAPRIN